MEKRLGDWFDRLREVIEAEGDKGRDMKTLTRMVGNTGPNYVQQLVKDQKGTSVDKFVRLLAVLGTENAIYIILGERMTDEGVRLIASLPPETQKDALNFLRSLRGVEDK